MCVRVYLYIYIDIYKNTTYIALIYINNIQIYTCKFH